MSIKLTLVLAAGLNRVSTLLRETGGQDTPVGYVQYSYTTPPANAAPIAVGGASMAAVTDGRQLAPNDFWPSESMGGQGLHDLTQEYIYGSAGDKVIFEGATR